MPSEGLLVFVTSMIAVLVCLDFHPGSWAPRYSYNGKAIHIVDYITGSPRAQCNCRTQGQFVVIFRPRFGWNVSIGRYATLHQANGECPDLAWVVVHNDQLKRFGHQITDEGKR